MKSIKIELELPEFEKELSISVALKRDGETISVVSSPSGAATVSPVEIKEDPVWKQRIEEPEPPKKTSTKKKSGGNMMDLSF